MELRRTIVLAVLTVGVLLMSTPGVFAAQDLLVGVGSSIQRYTWNSDTSQWDLVGNFVTGTGVWDFCYGPDQNGDGYPELYVSDNGAGVIRWYDGKNGGSAGTTYATAAGEEPVGIAFQEGTLYVALDKPNTVAKRTSSGILEPVVEFHDPRHITFGPDHTGDGVGDLYISGGNEVVPNYVISRIRVYGYYPDEAAWLSKVFTSLEPQGGELDYNFALDWGPDATGDGVGDLYVADFRMKSVELMDGVTGVYTRDFVTGLGFPVNLKWGPDGRLYVNDHLYNNEVAIFDGSGTKVGSIPNLPLNMGLAFLPEDVPPVERPTVGASNKVVQNPLTVDVALKYVWIFWGKVSNRTADAFDIDDGSGVIIHVVATGNTVADGNFVAVKGMLSGAGTATPTLTAQSVTQLNP